ncbi:MAG: glycosyltransferase family 2 protein [Polyangiaceae bacterium]|nr:glycosyltransferase family 2 protein [Polyangiaceae bacterium]
MYQGSRIAVVVPAYREQQRIEVTIAGLPSWVDHVVVVDDASDDGTSARVRALADTRVTLIRHEANRGVGAAIVSGYRAALAQGADVLVVMAGDNQMDPRDLPALLAPVVWGHADYVKGNRFLHVEAARMPLPRRLGSAALSRLTRALTRLDVDDTQCGYTALGANAARALPLEELWPRYGYPNDLLGMLAARRLLVREVPVRPVYAGEASGLRPWHLATIAWVALRRHALERGTRSAASSLGDVAIS